MWIRSMMLVCAVGCVGTSEAADDPSAAVTDQSAVAQNGTLGPNFQCGNQSAIQVVSCVGTIAVLPITVNVKNVRVLNDNELKVLDGDLNNLSLLDGNILDGNKILDDVEATVLTDFLDKFLINVSKNDIDVCAVNALGIQLCK
jgi:hypothetical protein